jgi:hypothetical protein
MIITPEQQKEITGLLNDKQTYGCSLIRQRWSHGILGEQSSLYGNIVTFAVPIDIGTLSIEQGIVIAAELPNVNMFGGVCFQRLYIAQLGSILCEILDQPCSVDENSIFVGDKQASVTITNRVKESALFHIIFSTTETEECPLHTLKLTDEQLEKFQQGAVSAFHHLSKSIFLETQRDNF